MFHGLLASYNKNKDKLHQNYDYLFSDIAKESEEHISLINVKFIRQLKNILTLSPDTLPAQNPVLLERINKAAAYYLEKLASIYAIPLSSCSFDTDNKEVRKELSEATERFELALVLKTSALKSVTKDFDIQKYLRALADSASEFKTKLKVLKTRLAAVDRNLTHKKLYGELAEWRKAKAEDMSVSAFMILPYKTMRLIAEQLPATEKELSKIKGLGKIKIKQYGSEILEIVNQYCIEKAIEREFPADDMPTKKKKEKKPESKSVSLALFRENKSIQEIASERGFAESTIWGHLSHYVNTGELQAEDLLDAGRIAEIKEFVRGKSIGSLAQIMMESNGKFTFNELKIILSGNTLRD